ncbi:hypothetical protein VCRA2112O349_350001 [Vibrio crassostreae]|nr:hypothetical protein VCRA2113O362_350001 [Vibrio crassostreae]CAK2063071.1 hypothetical protein VCRA2114O369_360001 [Vibrio crassostreae]CAK2342596.1 hypothetical protein VCRA2113O361_360018 [Vibrio crassostreae]CAK2351278.1 hypothetical protein VCRA2113O355_350001 [Vibrio crassostreae]CAK2493113.1 hypothetical protein VCRA2113O352_340001 [Vibrio crassostreae]
MELQTLTSRPVGSWGGYTQSSNQGELIVDPFFGSGSTLIAANNLKRKVKGNDISPAAHEHFEQRQKSHSMQIHK